MKVLLQKFSRAELNQTP